MGQDLYPQEGAIKEARFLHPTRSSKMEVSSRASENAAFGVQQLGGRNLHKRSAPLPYTPQPKTCVHPGRQKLGAEAHTSEIRPRERARVGCVETA